MANDYDYNAAADSSSSGAAAATNNAYYSSDDEIYQLELELKQTYTLYFVLFSILLTSVLILSKLLHHCRPLNKILSEAALVLMISMSVGYLINAVYIQGAIDDDGDANAAEDAGQVAQKLLSFSPNVFFMALLPPIIFNSGYQLRRELFYRHISPITLFAALGTTASALVCAGLLWVVKVLGLMGSFDPTPLELLAFGSLIAATDTVSVIAVLQAKRVDPHLFYGAFC